MGFIYFLVASRRVDERASQGELESSVHFLLQDLNSGLKEYKYILLHLPDILCENNSEASRQGAGLGTVSYYCQCTNYGR